MRPQHHSVHRSRPRRTWRRPVAAALVVGAAVGGPLGAVAAGTSAAPAFVRTAATPHTLNITSVWSATLNDAGSPIALSSPNVADLDGRPAVVVGDEKGDVYAYHLADGTPVAGWPYAAGAPVNSSPSVAPVNPGGLDTVYVGSGDAAESTVGGYQAISPGGADQWFVTAKNPPTDALTPQSGVQASMAVGTLQGQTAVVAGNLGENEYAMNAASGAVLPGFPWYEGDSNFTTPAIADVYRDGTPVIIEGGDSTAGISYGSVYANGGHMRVLSPTGNAGLPEPNSGLLCQANVDQVVQGSPAVGEFTSNPAVVGAVFGTGSYYPGASTTDHLIAMNAQNCGQLWNAGLDGTTSSSPALADAMGNGQLQVIEGTQGGSVYVLNGNNGATIWTTHVAGPVYGSVTTADLTGAGHQDLLVPTPAGVQILDGTSGTLLGTLDQYEGFQNSPLVTDDPNGTIGITVAGYNSANQGYIQHFEVSGSNGSSVDEAGAWPQFHHDPQLTGDAGTSVNLQVPCTAPDRAQGYVMAASDGGVFNYGNLPFCGSTGAITLNQPVVGIAHTADGGGYWMVAADGGIYAFGDAPFYGSMGGTHLNKPIVGMAPTPDGRGYWLVASDGGVFAFGDAAFHGSTGNISLVQPIVGMAATADGGGYWMVARDGGVFAFGDAVYHGSMGGQPLDRPVVGMAPDPATGGYWLVASDGGVFAFDAPFYGSMGGQPLNRPIVGMEVTGGGGGYWFVAADGGIFSYGTAAFYGSTGAISLNRPIVGMSGF